MEKNISKLLESIIKKGKYFNDENNGISCFMIEDLLYIKDEKDIEFEDRKFTNNYILSLSKKKIRHIAGQKKKDTFYNEMNAMIEEKGFTFDGFIAFIRELKPIAINENIICHRIIT